MLRVCEKNRKLGMRQLKPGNEIGNNVYKKQS